jgi:hypothetical protein
MDNTLNLHEVWNHELRQIRNTCLQFEEFAFQVMTSNAIWVDKLIGSFSSERWRDWKLITVADGERAREGPISARDITVTFEGTIRLKG